MKPNNYYNRPVFVKILTLPGLRGVSHVNINSESVVFTITPCQQSFHFSTHLWLITLTYLGNTNRLLAAETTGIKNIDSSSGCAIIIKVFLTSLKQLEDQPNTVNNNSINNNIITTLWGWPSLNNNYD